MSLKILLTFSKDGFTLLSNMQKVLYLENTQEGTFGYKINWEGNRSLLFHAENKQGEFEGGL